MTYTTQTSQQLMSNAKQHIPGGVNSPVRAFTGVGGDPLFIERADQAYLYDVDNNAYVDYVGSWGPMIVGHNHPKIKEAVVHAVSHGLSFGAPTAIEIAMAEKVKSLMPNLEKVRFVNSGTEATMTAIRLARGYSGRNKFIKFTGCYHGHSDALLVKAGSGALTLGVPSSPGVPNKTTEDTITLAYNDLESIRQTFSAIGEEIAAVIVEPVAGNMNCIPPLPEFLPLLRKLCNEHGSILIFDEVMTGFRVAQGGAQALYEVKPDLTTLGKIIGGGMPIGAIGGAKEIMDHLAPEGPVYQAGTLSGNPIAMAAGLSMLELISDSSLYTRLAITTQKLTTELQALADKHSIPFTTNTVGSMFGLFFSEEKHIRHYEQVVACNLSYFQQFYHHMLKAGVYLAPSAFEAGFVSLAHQEQELALTLQAADSAFNQLKLSM